MTAAPSPARPSSREPGGAVEPLWMATPAAVRAFNWRHSLPRTLAPTLLAAAGVRKVGREGDRATVLVCTVAEDVVRVWAHFARRQLDADRFEVLVVDGAGDVRRRLLGDGVRVIRLLNWGHGRKVDLLLRRVVRSEVVFLCDDDRFLVGPVAGYLDYFADPRCVAASLSPRGWWSWEVDGRDEAPMGTYAVLLRRPVLLRHGLRLESPRCPEPAGPRLARRFHGDAKEQGYDTADAANEALLALGHRVVTFPGTPCILGFDGLSAPRILVHRRGAGYVRAALGQAPHYRPGSINGSALRGAYGNALLDRLYEELFGEPPRRPVGLRPDELREIVAANPALDEEARSSSLTYLDGLDERLARLRTLA